MRIIISDLLTAVCELSGKETECVEVQLTETKSSTPAIVATGELLKLVRFSKVQEEKSKTTSV